MRLVEIRYGDGSLEIREVSSEITNDDLAKQTELTMFGTYEPLGTYARIKNLHKNSRFYKEWINNQPKGEDK